MKKIKQLSVLLTVSAVFSACSDVSVPPERTAVSVTEEGGDTNTSVINSSPLGDGTEPFITNSSSIENTLEKPYTSNGKGDDTNTSTPPKSTVSSTTAPKNQNNDPSTSKTYWDSIVINPDITFEEYPHPVAKTFYPTFTDEDSLFQFVYMIPSITAQDARDSIPNNISPERRAVAEAAIDSSMLYKVEYFWGGKNTRIEPNPRWGELRDAPEAPGLKEKFGLDCSGYLQHVFIKATNNLKTKDIIPTYSGAQADACKKNISAENAQTGDVVYRNNSFGQHIGIVIANLGDGVLRVAHASYPKNQVVVQDFLIGEDCQFTDVLVPPYSELDFK